ncbi:MAG: monovalent cation/H(+) antiporter subunit G [Myxococcota bacterium]|nr:monovalent cation/H(+) antiporter subunit G [Myxococcota bacterium]
MTDWAIAGLLLAGAFMVVIAALGLVRLPDLYTRMHASTKPATLGTILIVAALAIEAGTLGVAARSLLIVLFFLLTAPVAAHQLGHAAYWRGIPLWSGTLRDDLASSRPGDEPGEYSSKPNDPS